MNFSHNAWYLVTIYSLDRKAIFDEDPDLRRMVREEWQQLSQTFPEWTSESVGIEKHCLNAVVALRKSLLEDSTSDERLATILTHYRNSCDQLAVRRGKPPVWSPNFRQKPLRSEEAYRNARTFVIQSILGKELSNDWEEED